MLWNRDKVLSWFSSLETTNKYGVVLLSPHVALWEYRCRHCGELPEIRSDGHALAILTLFHIFEQIRELWGKPIKITSGYRCQQYQEQLRREGKKAAVYSPHVWGVALDIVAGGSLENELLYKLITQRFRWLRVGYHKYEGKFIHLDVAPALPTEDMPHGIVEIAGQKYLVSDLWGKRGTRW